MLNIRAMLFIYVSILLSHAVQVFLLFSYCIQQLLHAGRMRGAICLQIIKLDSISGKTLYSRIIFAPRPQKDF